MNTVNVTVKQISPTTSQGVMRQHTVLIDRTEAKGGIDAGPMGGELLLTAIGGCFMSNLLEIFRRRDIPIHDAVVDVIGTTEGTPARYTTVDMRVSGTYPDSAAFQKWVEMAERACIVANTLRPAVTIKISVVANQVPA
jgi:putative redox protein